MTATLLLEVDSSEIAEMLLAIESALQVSLTQRLMDRAAILETLKWKLLSKAGPFIISRPETFTAPFDREHLATDYRTVIERRNAATADIDRTLFNSIAHRMRAEWKEWKGEDSLHAVAFGEAFDPVP